METLYSGAEVSKKIRKDLKVLFPNIKFSVRYRSFSGGDAVDVEWNLGPTYDEVDKVVKIYQEGKFNGMEDIYEYKNNIVKNDKGEDVKLGGVKYVQVRREVYNDEEEVKDYNLHSSRYAEEKDFQTIVAKALASDNRIEWKGRDETFFYENSTGNENDTCYSIARSIISANKFDHSSVQFLSLKRNKYSGGSLSPEAEYKILYNANNTNLFSENLKYKELLQRDINKSDAVDNASIEKQQTESTIIPAVEPKKEKTYPSVDMNADYRNQFLLNKAIEQFLDSGKMVFTEDEKIFLSRYAGSGGLAKFGAIGAGLLWEYYTPDQVVKKMWGLAFKYGYQGGRILEPSIGIGRFAQYAPDQSEVMGYEINSYSAKIAKILYPTITVYNKPFEAHFFNGNIYNENYERGFSLVIGNPPYGEFVGKYAGMGEKTRTHASQYDHYFIYRGLQLLKKDGLLVFIIPSSFLKNNAAIKDNISEMAELIDAYRLPNGIFPTTEIGTDIIVLKKL